MITHVRLKTEPQDKLLCLGFVGADGGPIRAICVNPLTGVAKGVGIHELIFEFPQEPLVAPESKELKSGKRR